VFMHKIVCVLVTIVLSTLVATAPSPVPFASAAPDNQYEVFSPWAEVDPVPPRGISPRLDTLAGKKIGLFTNRKRAAKPMAEAIAKQLKEKYPTAEFSFFEPRLTTIIVAEQNDGEKFISWVKSMNAVIAMVGD
jgi:hypothetical protein